MAEFACQRSENSHQRLGIFRQVQKDESFPEADAYFVQWIGRLIEAFALFHVRRTEKVSIQTVCPGVIGALNRLAKMAFVLFTEPRSAVAAGVVEGADLTELIADNQRAFTCDLCKEVISCSCNVALVANTQPLFRKDAFLFLGENLL